MLTRSELKEAALKSLKGKWQGAVLFVLLICLVSWLLGSLSDPGVDAMGDLNPTTMMNLIAAVVALLIAAPMTLASTKYFYNLARNKKADWTVLQESVANYSTTFWLWLRMQVQIFLWTLLLIIPGIVAMYRYSQAWYIHLENPKMTAGEVLKKSGEMMEGHKWELFVLHVSFLGWAILVCLTVGIGSLWFTPYFMTTMANYYVALKGSKK